jgi:hypothetical protein
MVVCGWIHHHQWWYILSFVWDGLRRLSNRRLELTHFRVSRVRGLVILLSRVIGQGVEKIEDILYNWFLFGRLIRIGTRLLFSHHRPFDVGTTVGLLRVVRGLSFSILFWFVLALSVFFAFGIQLFIVFTSELPLDQTMIVVGLIFIPDLLSHFIHFIHFFQLSLIDHLLLFGESPPLQFSEISDLWQGEIGVLFHHLFPLICHKQQKSSPGTSSFFIIVDDIGKRGVFLRTVSSFLSYNVLQFHPALPLFDQLVLQICELWVFTLSPAFILPAKLHKVLKSVRNGICKLTNLYKKGITKLRLSSMVCRNEIMMPLPHHIFLKIHFSAMFTY